MSDKVKVGVIGCGMISQVYMKNVAEMFREIEILGAFDINDEAAAKRTEEFSLPRRYHSLETILADPDIDIILNLSIPLVHFETTSAAIKAGKHVYSEKPLGVTFQEGYKLAVLAKQYGVQLCSSPDTSLGSSIQTCRKLVDDGYIGDIVGVSANLIKRGVETWHPNPNFLYQPGAGPLLDMGPYYLTALLHVVGPFTEVSGMSAVSFPTRVITSKPKYGEIIQVNVPTYVNSLLRFKNGAIGTFTATFDVYRANLPYIEVYGSEGTLSMPNPNDFSGPIRIYRQGKDEFLEFPSIFDYRDNSRGLGLADMAKAIRTGREARTNAEVAVHVLETMDSILESEKESRHITLTTTCQRPVPMKLGGVMGILD